MEQSKWIDRRSNESFQYGRLVATPVGAPTHSVGFTTPGETRRTLGVAKRARRVWLLRIEGHQWEVTPDMPTARLNVVPGTPITRTSVKGFPSWQACAKEVERLCLPAEARTYPGFTGPISADDVLMYWHDTGALGPHNCYARVLKLGKTKVKIRSEQGHEVWKDPAFFAHKVSPKEVAELQADKVKI